MSDIDHEFISVKRFAKSAGVGLTNLPFFRAASFLLMGALVSSCSPTPITSDMSDVGRVNAVDAIELPDLSGIWQALNTAHWDVEGHTARRMPATNLIGAYGVMQAGTSVVEGGEIPYLPEMQAQRESNQADWARLDPAAKCYIPGIPRQTYMPAPFQILQTDSEIFIAYQWGSNSRSIFMDRPGSSAPIPSWMGYSLGQWEGETLVVDVTSQVPDTWFDAAGNYHSDALHVEERYRLIDDSHIEYEATITDPKVYREPWTIRMPLYRRIEDDARILEFKCVEFAEDLLYEHLRKDYEGPKALDGSVPENPA